MRVSQHPLSPDAPAGEQAEAHAALMNALVQALLDGDQSLAVDQARALRERAVGHDRIIAEGLEAAMGRLEHKCTVEQFNLLEIMLCGRAVMAVMKELYPPGAPQPHSKGSVVLAALEGDVHDLGKNILKIILTASGYRVVDCGRDCPMDALMDAVAREAPLAVGISGLLSTVVPQVRQVRARLDRLGLERVRVMAGGAVLKQACAQTLNVDFVAQTSFDGLHFLDSLLPDARPDARPDAQPAERDP